MAEPIGALRVELSANAAQFEKDMGRARRAAKSAADDMGGGFAKFDKAISAGAKSLVTMRAALFALAGVGALAVLLKRSLDTADAIAKMADRTGLGIEALQELGYAADLAGIDTEQFSKTIERLNVAMAEARNGNLTYADGFRMAGVALVDAQGKARDTESVFMDLADAVGQNNNATERAAIVATIFGARIGSRLLPLFKDGAAGIAAMRQEARELGVVLDGVMVREAEKANDQLSRMGKILDVNLTRTLLSLTPQIIALGDAFIKYIKPFTQWLVEHLPDATAPAIELERRIAELQERISSFDPGAGIARPAGLRTLEKMKADLTVLNALLEERRRKEAILAAGVGGGDDNTANEAADKRTRAVEKQIAALQQVAEAERLIGVDKEVQNALTAAQNALLDEQGNLTRELNGHETQRIIDAIELADVNKREVSLRQHLVDLERANVDFVMELGIQGEVRRAQILAQNLLIDEQGNKIRDLTAAELAIIDAQVRRNDEMTRELALQRHILGLEKENADTVVGIGVDEEVRRAIIEAQNLLIDEQGNKLRDLTEEEKARIEATVRTKGELEQQQRTIEDLERFGTQAFDRIGESITRAFVEGKGEAIEFGNIVQGILSEIMQEIIKMAVLNPIKNSIFGTVLPTIASAGFPTFATGGTHTGGFRIVGENGPELEATGPARIYSAAETAEILSADVAAPGGPGGDVTVNVYAPPGSKVEERQSTGPGGRTIDVIIDEAVARNISTPGSRTGRALRNTMGVSQQLQGR